MSGPIIRKYGFPNHEQIFGKRPMEHGAEDEAEAVKPAAEKAEKAPEEGKKGKPKAGPKKK